MSGLALELDPVAVRQSLQASRDRGEQWEQAWNLATGHLPNPEGDDRLLVTFMEKHFRAAYYRSVAPEGRCDIPERDVSDAVPVTAVRQRDREIIEAARSGLTYREIAGAHSVSKQRVGKIVIEARKVLPAASRDSKRCRSGDGCDREATHGTFGRMWCEYHHGELRHVAVKFADVMEKVNPRNNGNTSLFTHEAA